MRWSDRIKLSFETFKRVALPLYGWYLIFTLIGVVSFIAAFIPAIIWSLHNGLLSPGVPGFSGAPVPSPTPFTGPFNPNPPVPPGYGFSNGFSNGFSQQFPPYGFNPLLSFVRTPLFPIFLAVLLILAWIATSAFMTGLFNLTRKGVREKVFFRDFRFSGLPRVLSWYGIIALIGFLIVIGGVAGAYTLRRTSYAIPVFGGLYVIIVVALGLFLSPWLLTAVYYMLMHREHSFSKAFGGSWNFYRRHMGDLWLLFLTLAGIQILLSIINRSSTSLGFLVLLLISPFTAIIPVVWVLTLEQEDHPEAPIMAGVYPTPPNTITPGETPPYPGTPPYAQPASPEAPPYPEASPDPKAPNPQSPASTAPSASTDSSPDPGSSTHVPSLSNDLSSQQKEPAAPSSDETFSNETSSSESFSSETSETSDSDTSSSSNLTQPKQT